MATHCRPAAGLRIHDWGEASAVVFVPSRASTHLIDGEIAAALAEWTIDQSRPSVAGLVALPPVVAVHMDALMMAGILEASVDSTPLSTPLAATSAPESGS